MSAKAQNQAKVYTQIGLIIGQVNLVEMKINEIIATYYAKSDKVADFSRDLLFSNKLRLSDKLELLKEIAKRCGQSVNNGDLQKWKKVRNVVAHGIPGKNNEGESTLLLNDTLYDVGEKFKEFGEVHDKMIELLNVMNKKVRDL